MSKEKLEIHLRNRVLKLVTKVSKVQTDLKKRMILGTTKQNPNSFKYKLTKTLKI